jgi:hypothetical protein
MKIKNLNAKLATLFFGAVSIIGLGSFAISAQAAGTLVNAAGRTGVCPGVSPNGGVDCVYPTASYTSYKNLYSIEHRGGSGADFWICNASAGYNPPVSVSTNAWGCVHKNLGPGWESTFRNPFSLPTAVDIFVNVHNDGQSTTFKLN